MEDIADAANGYTREEIYSRIYGRATKYDKSSRPKISHMTKGNDDKVIAKKDNQMPPLSPGDEGQAAEGSTNLQTNKATESIAEKETATDLAVTITDVINATPNAPNPHRQDPGGETNELFGSLPNELAEIETCAPAHPMPNPILVPTSRYMPAAKHGRMAAALFIGTLPQ